MNSNDSENNQPPNMFRKAANFARGSVDHAASGFENVSENVKSHRMKICNNCEFMIGSSHNPVCSRCGCYLNLKTSWASQSCPVEKWGALNQKQSGGCKSCGKKKT